jgi:hypothetical protein
MSETTLLRQNAIRNNASVGAPQHGPVKTGELPHVQVKPVAAAPQIRESQQQKTVSILAPNSKGAVTSGDLPMVQIKMGQNGPQTDDGRDNPVLVKDHYKQTISTGGLPMVQVKMESTGPKIQTMPNVKGGPPRIQTAAPALSAPRIAQSAPGVVRVAAPVAQIAAPPLPELPELSTDQWMICQHALSKYVEAAGAVVEGSESGEASEAVQLAKKTIDDIDQMLVAIAIRTEAAANAAAAAEAAPTPAPARAGHYVAPRAITGGYYSPAALSPQGHAQVQAQAPAAPAPAIAQAPRTGYVMQQPSVRRTQLNSGLVPRGVRRAQAGVLPTVIVKMDGQRASVQNQAEIDAARAALEAQAQAQVQEAQVQVQAANVAEDLPQG